MEAEEQFFEFKGANDIVGIAMLEIQSADDLPRLANSEFPSLLFVFFSYRLSVMRTVRRHFI